MAWTLISGCGAGMVMPSGVITPPVFPGPWIQAQSGAVVRPFVEPLAGLEPELRWYLYRKHRFNGDQVAGERLSDGASLAYINASGAGDLAELARIQKKQRASTGAVLGGATAGQAAMAVGMGAAGPAAGAMLLGGGLAWAGLGAGILGAPDAQDFAAARAAFNPWLKSRLFSAQMPAAASATNQVRPPDLAELEPARAHLAAGRWHEALSELHGLRAVNKDGPEVVWGIVTASDGLDESDAARAFAEEGARRWPEDKRFKRRLALGHAR